MTDIIIDPNKRDRPTFTSEGVYKSDKLKCLCWIVTLQRETLNPDEFRGECILDGKRVNVIAVERKSHIPPWRKGEQIALAVRM